MKLHHVMVVLFMVVLIGAGYVLTVWQHSSLAHDAGHENAAQEDTVHEATASTSETPQAAEAADTREINVAEGSISGNGATSQDGATTPSQNDADQTHDGQNTAATSSADNATQSAQTDTANTAEASGSTTQQASTSSAPETTTVAGTEVVFTVTATRQEDAQSPLVTITLKPSDKPLSLSGWRLADAIGVAGHADHIYFFGELSLNAKDTLTIHSSCGRDEGLVRYWCLSQPLSLLDAASKALYFLDADGNPAFTCTPTATDQNTTPYRCEAS